MSRTLPAPHQGSRDRAVRLIITHWILGATLGMVCAALLLWLDIAGLCTLMLRADRVMWEGLVLLFGGFAVTFGGVVSAAAVMAISTNDDNPDGGPGVMSAAATTTPELASSGGR